MPHQIRSLALLLALLLLAAAAPPAALAQPGERCFPETGHCIGGAIRTFWEQNGGLAVFGLPLGPQQEVAGEDGRTIQAQWFERHRLELHPENPAPYNVLLGRLGVDRLERQGRDWRSFPPLDPNDADAERCRFFSETNHQVCDEFLQAFRSNGLSFAGRPGITFEESLALFGLPLSEPTTETIEGREFTVQWFERARFELHPENPAPYRVLFGRLGAELGGGQGAAPAPALEGREWRLVSFGPAAAPTPAVAAAASTLSFDGERASGNTGCNGFGGSYRVSGGTLTFGPVISTLIACTDEAVTAQERAVLAALQGEVPFTIAGDTLTLSYDGGRQALTYSAAPAAAGAAALVGTAWELASFGSPGAASLPAAGRPATLSFDGERVSGSIGCNNLAGPYAATGERITFGALAVTRALCTDDDLARQEAAILAALQGEVPFTIAGDTLTLSYDGGRQALTYRAAGAGASR